MPRNQLPFFATKDDLASLLRAVDSEQSLQFVLTGLFDSPVVEPMESLLGVSNLGSVAVGDANHEPAYLVARRGIPIEVRPAPQRRGGVKYAMDQLANPETIAFRTGGAFGETCLIAGQVGTASDHPSSLELFKLFSKQIRHRFTKIKSFYVGREAGELFGKGWRLTANAKAPSLYDLKRD